MAFNLEVEVDDVFAPAGATWASITLGDVTIFTELVKDDKPEEHIVAMFARRLRDLLESD